MDNLRMSELREEQRRIQYLADVARESAEKITRGETALDPNTPENREKWNTGSEDNISGIILYTEKLDGKSFTPRERTRQQHEQNLRCERRC